MTRRAVLTARRCELELFVVVSSYRTRRDDSRWGTRITEVATRTPVLHGTDAPGGAVVPAGCRSRDESLSLYCTWDIGGIATFAFRSCGNTWLDPPPLALRTGDAYHAVHAIFVSSHRTCRVADEGARDGRFPGGAPYARHGAGIFLCWWFGEVAARRTGGGPVDPGVRNVDAFKLG